MIVAALMRHALQLVSRASDNVWANAKPLKLHHLPFFLGPGHGYHTRAANTQHIEVTASGDTRRGTFVFDCVYPWPGPIYPVIMNKLRSVALYCLHWTPMSKGHCG